MLRRDNKDAECNVIVQIRNPFDILISSFYSYNLNHKIPKWRPEEWQASERAVRAEAFEAGMKKLGLEQGGAQYNYKYICSIKSIKRSKNYM